MSVLKFLLIEKNGSKRPLEFRVRRLLDAGYTGRNQEMVMRHVEELKSHGIAAPDKIPAFYPVPRELVTTDDEIEVLGAQTSDEVEVVFLFERGAVYIGVGSDHTDRELEKISIAKSKVMWNGSAVGASVVSAATTASQPGGPRVSTALGEGFSARQTRTASHARSGILPGTRKRVHGTPAASITAA